MTRGELIDRAELMDVDVVEAMTMRVRYLAEERDRLLESIESREDEILFDDSINDLNKVFMSLIVLRDKKALKSVKREIKSLTEVPREGEITDDMVETARNYPIENLVEFRNGRCKGFCHDSDSFSMARSRTENYVWCNVCHLAHNPIDVLMRRDGYSFIDAVKQLQ